MEAECSAKRILLPVLSVKANEEFGSACSHVIVVFRDHRGCTVHNARAVLPRHLVERGLDSEGLADAELLKTPRRLSQGIRRVRDMRMEKETAHLEDPEHSLAHGQEYFGLYYSTRSFGSVCHRTKGV